MPSHVLVIGLDALEAPLVERAVAAKELPAFAALHARASRFHLTNPMRSHPGAIWPEICLFPRDRPCARVRTRP